MSTDLHDLFETCPHYAEKIKKGAKTCRHCQISVRGWRRYLLQPLKLFLELSALIASLVAICSFSLTQQQLELQRVANEKTQKQIEQTQRQIEQNDTTSSIQRSEVAELRKWNVLLQARMENEEKTFREINKPWIELGRIDCNFDGNDHVVYLNIQNSGLQNAENIGITVEILDTVNWIAITLPSDTINVLTSRHERVQPYRVPNFPYMCLRVLAMWKWSAVNSIESAEKYYVVRSDSARSKGCDAKSMMDSEGRALWSHQRTKVRL